MGKDKKIEPIIDNLTNAKILSLIDQWRWEFKEFEDIEEENGLEPGTLIKIMSKIPGYNGNRTSITKWLKNEGYRSKTNPNIIFRYDPFIIVLIQYGSKKILSCQRKIDFIPIKLIQNKYTDWLVDPKVLTYELNYWSKGLNGRII